MIFDVFCDVCMYVEDKLEYDYEKFTRRQYSSLLHTCVLRKAGELDT
jgi:hypothetical protein